ncbi:MAG: hypothetical protein IPN01_29495 [Deltaproteobacteria bacterium]|nr:hypothetical protein [Deltaproteobacteria bacterium]
MRQQSPFDGPFGAYYGGHWMRLNYPNPWDAARGVDAGLITVAQQREITQRYWAGLATNERTSLGGGIGMHGWAEGGPTRERQMGWGCIVLPLSTWPRSTRPARRRDGDLVLTLRAVAHLSVCPSSARAPPGARATASTTVQAPGHGGLDLGADPGPRRRRRSPRRR